MPAIARRTAPRLRLRPAARAAIGSVLLALLAACRVDATVDVALDEHGAGAVSVTLVADRELVESVDDLASELAIDDLTARGWSVVGPAATADGGLELVLTRDVASAAEATAVLAELNGSAGPLLDPVVEQRSGFGRVDSAFSGSVALGTDLASFSDDVLGGALDGTPYARELEASGLRFEDVFGLTVQATLPGEPVETNGQPATAPAEATAARWVVAFPDGATATDVQPLLLRSAAVDDRARLAQRLEAFAPWALAAWAVFFVGVVLPALALRRRRRRPASTTGP